MAQAAAIGDAFQVRVIGRMEGQETQNVLHFRCVAATASVLDSLILVLAQCFIDHLLPVLTSKWSFERIVWKRVHPTLGPETESIPQGAAAGAGSANALPSFCSVVFSERTDLGGKSHRGRMYLPGIPEGATTDSFLNTADPYWAALIAFALCVVQKFIENEPIGTDQWRLNVYSRKIGGTAFPYGANGFTEVREFVPHALIGTTRSRKVGRGS
jgi:hypothetical protein